ncbi:M56 family metallopeptidase [Algoriphagus confluentis]|uniref:Peptidase M56 domain-containing protein n=1 Tax=Algoriphagus confluentis TaxID=1697556 RepID=A0ABQ6PSF0_9BACT|nr:hypothetical protein Aconfl_31350 [Algoriphagus confluentis]
MEYLLKSVLCLLLLLLFHRLFLQQEVLHRFNRFYLLASVLGSFLIPLITFEIEKEVPLPPVSEVVFSGESYSKDFLTTPTLTEMAPVASTSKAEIPWTAIAWTVYLSGVLIFLIRFLRNIRIIWDQIRRNIRVIYKEETLVLLDREISPFSFLSYIFFSKSTYENEGIPEAVFLHEQCHVREKHSWDILLLEVLLIPFWFHPGLHFALQSIRLNHEFIADQEVVKSTSVQDYQFLLVSVLSGQNRFTLGTDLNFSLTKKRFTMMKKTPKPGIQVLKLASLVVFLGVVVTVFAEKVFVNTPVFSKGIEATSLSSDKEKKVLLSLKESGEILFEGKSVSKEQLLTYLSEIEGQDILVELFADPGVQMGDLAEIQDLLRGQSIRKLSYQQAALPKSVDEQETQREKKYRDAVFMIESEDMEYTQKSYSALSTKEKEGLLLPKHTEKKTPDPQAFESWKNKEEVALWIDGKPVENSVLDSYKPEDFVWAFQSRVFPNARSEKYPQPFQVSLYKEAYFDQKLGPSSEMFQPLTNQDTITLTQRNLTSFKDLSRYPDPVTAYLQKNARYEKLKSDGNADSPQVKAELESLYQELNAIYNQTPANRQKRLVKPLPLDPSSSQKESKGKAMAEVSSDPNSIPFSMVNAPLYKSEALKMYIKLYGEYQTKAYENQLFSKWTDQEIIDLEKDFQDLRTRFSLLSPIERTQVQRVNFPFFKTEKNGITIYKKIEDLTEEERRSMAC